MEQYIKDTCFIRSIRFKCDCGSEIFTVFNDVIVKDSSNYWIQCAKCPNKYEVRITLLTQELIDEGSNHENNYLCHTNTAHVYSTDKRNGIRVG